VGAYNWIAVDAQCPACGALARIRCQTHVASDYGGDSTGRFHDREYALGQKMAWWPPGHERFESELANEEACYSECGSCGADLCVVIRFRELVPEAVVSITREEDWPGGYSR